MLNGIVDYFDVFGMYVLQVDVIEIIYFIFVINMEIGIEIILNNRDEICDYVNVCFDDDNDFLGCDNLSEDD